MRVYNTHGREEGQILWGCTKEGSETHKRESQGKLAGITNGRESPGRVVAENRKQ